LAEPLRPQLASVHLALVNLFAGVIRAVPVGVAYRDAPVEVLRQAVDAAVVFTHPTERGSEGAVAIAAAVAWLSK
jgi:ADP-ribosylglycohydrolase